MVRKTAVATGPWQHYEGNYVHVYGTQVKKRGDRTRRDRFSERERETAVAKFEDLRQKEKGNVRKSPKPNTAILYTVEPSLTTART